MRIRTPRSRSLLPVLRADAAPRDASIVICGLLALFTLVPLAARSQTTLDPPGPSAIWLLRESQTPGRCSEVPSFVNFTVLVLAHPTTSFARFEYSLALDPRITAIATQGFGAVIQVVPPGTPTDWLGSLVGCVNPIPVALTFTTAMLLNPGTDATMCLIGYRFADPPASVPRWYECDGTTAHDFAPWPPPVVGDPADPAAGCIVFNPLDALDCPVRSETRTWTALRQAFR